MDCNAGASLRKPEAPKFREKELVCFQVSNACKRECDVKVTSRRNHNTNHGAATLKNSAQAQQDISLWCHADGTTTYEDGDETKGIIVTTKWSLITYSSPTQKSAAAGIK